jgi:hypothetical protein
VRTIWEGKRHPPRAREPATFCFGCSCRRANGAVAVGVPAHAEALKRGLRIVYPLTDEPWGVHRFFVEDPGGTIVNVLAHIQ